MRTLVYSIHGFDKPFLETAAKDKHELAFTKEPLNENTANLANGYEAVVLFTSDKGNAQALEKLAAHGVRYLALRSAGFDHVDLPKARELGMKVAYVPSYSPYAIAEYSVALMLAMNRKLILGQELMKQNNFCLDQLVGFDLHEKTIGIVGTGKIGGAFTRIMHGFGCKLLGYDVEPDQQLIDDTNISYTSLEGLCEKSDVISVNCPLNVRTKYMFNKEVFSKMKKGVMFINTARGGVVNTNDLIDALDSGIIASAGLDVYEYEKPIFFYDHTGKILEDKLFEKLRSYSNVLITGHQAFLTKEALRDIASTTIANLDVWERNEISENEL